MNSGAATIDPRGGNHRLKEDPMDKLSNLFKDMNELREFVESMKGTMSSEEYELMLYACGLLENRAISDIVRIEDKEVQIDRFIAPMILDLNTNGIQTMASCSGLQAEHPENRFKPESGYLAIRYSEELLKYLVDNLVDPIIEVKQSECYLKPSILVIIQSNNDNVLKEKWKLIWNILKKRCNGT